ncbi:MAG: 50S ribosomal protein L14 [Promethearchaeota archaeon]
MGKKRKVGGKKGSIFKTKITRGINVGSIIKITDNSGAKTAKIIAVLGLKTRLNRYASACVGDTCVVAIQKGTPEMRKKKLHAIIVRQKQIIRRPDGSRIFFEDNAGIIITKDGDPKGSDIRGPIAREAAELAPRIASVASMIV